MRIMRGLPAVCFAVVLALTLAAAAEAATDVASITRSRAPERMWAPLTAADAALAGAGRGSDPTSGWSVNPALLGLVPRSWARGTGTLLDPRRSDVKATTLDYSDKSPLLTFGEAGLVFGGGRMSYGLYVAQDAYDKAEESFIDTAFSEVQSPITRENRFVSSLARAGLAAAWSRGPVALGAALELSRPFERWQTTPSAESQANPPFPQPVDVRLDGLAVGGAAGVVVTPEEWLTVGAAGRAAASTDLESQDGAKLGRDEIPFSATLGVHAGRAVGGSLVGSAEYTASREVSYGDTLGRGPERVPERVRLAAGYSYVSPAMPIEFRLGFAWSPYAGDGSPRYGGFGVGLGYRMQASVVRVSYSRESRRTPEGDTSARAFLVLGLDIRL